MSLFYKMNKIPVVFIHGFLGTSDDWEPVCSHLSDYDLIKLDLPGHGKTAFTKHFEEWIPSLPKMHLIGYSMGGRLAMQYANLFPEKIASLTLISAHRGINDPIEKQKRVQSDIEWTKQMTHSFDDFLTTWYDQPIFAGFRPNLTMRKTQNVNQLVQTFLHYSLAHQKFLEPKNALFVVGEKDQKYRDLYPDAVIISDAGHMVHLEQPFKLAQLIKKRVVS
jgi:2-succinyl-6-hydroxy-2,4-cyclohexadiene-1-carboxylate synthase